MMYQEINFCGIYVPPFFVSLLLTGLLYLVLHRLWDHIALQRWVWNRPVFEAALFLMLLTVVTFFLCSKPEISPSANKAYDALRTPPSSF